MCNVIKKMGEKMPERFFGFYIFLTTNLAISAGNNRITIQTIIFFSFPEM